MVENNNIRVESDSMGTMEVPVDAYYGASTRRAQLNFPISDLKFPRSFIKSLGLIKQAASRANLELGLLEIKIADGITRASQEIVDGVFDNQFVVDIFQTGSGTSTNTNANEVIANRATEILGGERGSQLVHPNDHVNKGQSSNDVIPTAIHLAALMDIRDNLLPGLENLRDNLKDKTSEFWSIIKTGRTHLQDATPIRLGQEFQGYTGQIEFSILRLNRACEELSYVALGGTAVGTGVNTSPNFASNVCSILTKLTGIEIKETGNHYQAQSTLDATVEASSVLRTIAISLNKISNDIRWMGAGPRAGIGELILPEVQPGSSIMPGKINPVIAESVIQVVAQVIGNDTTITLSGMGGYFELNTMMPVAAYNLLQSISLLGTSAQNFADQCVKGLQATTVGPSMVEKGLMIGTALTPAIGYDKAAQVAKEAAKTGSTIREVAMNLTDLTAEQLDTLLDPEKMTAPGS